MAPSAGLKLRAKIHASCGNFLIVSRKRFLHSLTIHKISPEKD